MSDLFPAPPLRAPGYVLEEHRQRWEQIAARVLGERPGIGWEEMRKLADEGLCGEVDGERRK